VSENGPEWKLVQDALNLKNRREAIIEFLRIQITEDLEKEYLFEIGKKFEKVQDLKEIEPYNQADMYQKHCDMLINFANAPTFAKKDKKRSQKLHRKLGF